MSGDLYIGLMSGTSMDGIDAALVRFDGNTPSLLAHHQHPWPEALLQTMQRLTRDAQGTLTALAESDAWAGEVFAQAALALLAKAAIAPGQVSAIGSHGQTLTHGPDSPHPYTLQIGDPNRIAERTGITTVADLRRRDIAAGGQGAPLVPAFHRACLRQAGEDRVILNIGGIANITLLPGDPLAKVSGFDTGPGNCLLDAWIQRQRQQPFDAGGSFAAEGQLRPALLDQLLADPYFARPAPKSTGPDYFSLAWLQRQLPQDIPPADVQATLAGLTARSIAQAIRATQPQAARVLICGGGIHNPRLRLLLGIELPDVSLESTGDWGLPPDWVEAMAFAWLARESMAGRAGNLPEVTGAQAPVVLGGIYPA